MPIIISGGEDGTPSLSLGQPAFGCWEDLNRWTLSNADDVNFRLLSQAYPLFEIRTTMGGHQPRAFWYNAGSNGLMIGVEANNVGGVLATGTAPNDTVINGIGSSIVFAHNTTSRLMTLTSSGIGYGSGYATQGTQQFAQGASAYGRTNSNSQNRRLWDWGLTTSDTMTLGDSFAPITVASSTTIFNNSFAVGNTFAGAKVNIGGSQIGPGSASVASLRLVTALTAGVGDDVRSFMFATNIATAASGTHAIVAQAYFDQPSVTLNGATITETANLYIKGALTGGTKNYALHIAAGAIRVPLAAGTLKVDANGELYTEA